MRSRVPPMDLTVNAKPMTGKRHHPPRALAAGPVCGCCRAPVETDLRGGSPAGIAVRGCRCLEEERTCHLCARKLCHCRCVRVTPDAPRAITTIDEDTW